MLGKLFVSLPYDENKPDIIKYLYDEYKRNYTQYFSFIMSSHYYADTNPWGTADVLLNPLRDKKEGSTSGSWCSLNISNSFLIVKLNGLAMKITNYIIGQNFRSSYELFNTWILEGSMNGKNWFILGNYSNTDSSFYKRGGTIALTTEKHLIRYIKFTQINQNSSHNNNFIIGTLSLFGDVYFYSNILTCSNNIYMPIYFLLIIIILYIT